MRTPLLTAAAAVFTCMGSAALADCSETLGELGRSLTGAGEIDYRTVLSGGTERQVRQLRDAARIFAANGMEDSCAEVVANIREMLDRRVENLRSTDSYATREAWTSSERQRLANAQPVSSLTAPVRAHDLIGADVRNLENEDLGEIEDVVLDLTGGGIQYAIVTSGGFFGTGEKLLAVPWRKFRVTPENDVFVLSIPAEVFLKAPTFERSNWMSVIEAQWRAANDKFYDENVL